MWRRQHEDRRRQRQIGGCDLRDDGTPVIVHQPGQRQWAALEWDTHGIGTHRQPPGGQTCIWSLVLDTPMKNQII